MDVLALAIERLLKGANLDVGDLGRAPNGTWLAEQLRELYKQHQKRLGDVEVRALSDEKVEIDFKQAAVRTLELRDRRWVLLNASGSDKTAQSIANPQIATILANP